MSKITEYTATTEPLAADVVLIDGTSGTRTLALDSLGHTGINHRNIYRGKNLGTFTTASFKSAYSSVISASTFVGLYTGDYFTINSHAYEIADFNYFLRTGDTDLTKPHLVIIPRSNLYNAQMNETNITTGGYTDSYMRSTGLADAITQFETDFGDMLLTYRDYLCNAVDSNGVESGGAWADCKVELMSEGMVYGSRIRSSSHIATTHVQQLAIFRLAPTRKNIRSWYWLRDVVSTTYFARVDNYGHAHNHNASNSYGVRPFALLGA